MLAAVLLLGFPSGHTMAYAKNGATLTASSISTEEDAAAVTVSLKGNPGLWGIKFKVGYDHSALRLSSVENGDVFSSSEVTMPDTLDKEEFVYFASSNKLEDITANGAVATLRFKVVDFAAEGTYPITLTLTQAINVDGKEVAMDVRDGAVTVTYEAGEGDVVFDKSKEEPLTIPLETDGEIQEVELDGAVMEKDSYEADQSGNVVFSAESCAGLKDGRHKISVVTEAGTTTTDLVVKSVVKTNAPDKAKGILIAALSIAALIVIAGMTCLIRKKRREKK